jgi:anti-sigma B factor antagonist
VATKTPLVIKLAGDFDVYSTEKLRRALEPAYAHESVIVDFTGVEYLDSTALTVLVRMRKRRHVAGMPPSIFVGLNENLRRLFEITHLDEVWPIYATLAEAQKHLP